MKRKAEKLDKLCDRLILRGETHQSIAEQMLGISRQHLYRLRNGEYLEGKTMDYYIGILERRLGR
jgi:hypothetical protein